MVYQPAGAKEPIAVPTSKAAIEKLEKSVRENRATGATTVTPSWLPEEVSVDEAAVIVETFKKVFQDIEIGSFDPAKQYKPATNKQSVPKKQLVLRANIQSQE